MILKLLVMLHSPSISNGRISDTFTEFLSFRQVEEFINSFEIFKLYHLSIVSLPLRDVAIAKR